MIPANFRYPSDPSSSITLTSVRACLTAQRLGAVLEHERVPEGSSLGATTNTQEDGPCCRLPPTASKLNFFAAAPDPQQPPVDPWGLHTPASRLPRTPM